MQCDSEHSDSKVWWNSLEQQQSVTVILKCGGTVEQQQSVTVIAKSGGTVERYQSARLIVKSNGTVLVKCSPTVSNCLSDSKEWWHSVTLTNPVLHDFILAKFQNSEQQQLHQREVTAGKVQEDCKLWPGGSILYTLTTIIKN